MRLRRGVVIGLALAVTVTAVAFATTQPVVRYEPPKITFRDLQEHNSIENVVVTKEGSKFVFTNTPVAAGVDGKGEPGCEQVALTVECPVAGTKSIVVKLRSQSDSASIDLGSRADKVKQKLSGGDEGDVLEGGPGRQSINGDDGSDDLSGGPGPDVLNGGPGTDTCDGGPGRDEIRNCEG